MIQLYDSVGDNNSITTKATLTTIKKKNTTYASEIKRKRKKKKKLMAATEMQRSKKSILYMKPVNGFAELNRNQSICGINALTNQWRNEAGVELGTSHY